MASDHENEGGGGPESSPEPTPQAPTTPSDDSRLSRGPLGSTSARQFGGVDFSGDMRDRKDGTWLAVLELRGDRLQTTRLEATGRAGLESRLMDVHPGLLRVEAVGLDFPFSLPLGFAEALLGGKVPEEGWWALARRFKSLSRPQYLQAVTEYRETHGEAKRFTDERASAFSPLHRVNPDLGPMTFHGIRMIAKGRSRHALRPFESAKGRLLFEVYPGGFVRRQGLDRERVPGGRLASIVTALARLPRLPVDVDAPWRSKCLSQRDALDALLAARCAAGAVLSGEIDRDPGELAPDQAERVKTEGWIYGLDL
jgi:hypothetical protein